MARKILITLVVILGLFLAYVASRPKDFRVERSVVVNAPAAVAFSYANDLHKANDWSPWAALDPAMKHSYEGPAMGVGASHAWEGNNQVGQGKQTIVESKANELVRMKLEFVKPMQATHEASFSFAPEGQGTKVTWAMYGERNFVAKLFGTLFNMDKMLGGDFEKGLAKLKEMAEAEAAKASPKPEAKAGKKK
jgi:hypothetical protein